MSQALPSPQLASSESCILPLELYFQGDITPSDHPFYTVSMVLKSSTSKQQHKRTQRVRHHGPDDDVITGRAIPAQRTTSRDSTLTNNNDASRLLNLPIELLE